MKLTLFKRYTDPKTDAGNFRYQAGAIRKTKGGECVTFELVMKSGDGTRTIAQDYSYRCQ